MEPQNDKGRKKIASSCAASQILASNGDETARQSPSSLGSPRMLAVPRMYLPINDLRIFFDQQGRLR